MSLTQEQIKKFSLDLCKIRLEDENLVNDIQEILEYINNINEVNTEGVEATVTVVEKENILRKDTVNYTVSPTELLECSELKKIGGQIAVSNIMK